MIRNARRIDFVTDRYPDISIKNTERNRRTAEGSLLIKITGGNQRRPQQWKKFLAHGKNKSTLIEFLLESGPKILMLKLLPTGNCMLLLMMIATN